MAQTQGFMTALYERLSRDDELNGDLTVSPTRKSFWNSMPENMDLPIWFILQFISLVDKYQNFDELTIYGTIVWHWIERCSHETGR